MQILKNKKPAEAENEMDSRLLYRINSLVKMANAVVEFNKSYSIAFEKKMKDLNSGPVVRNISSIINIKSGIEKMKLKKQGKAS